MEFSTGYSQTWKEGRRIVDLHELAKQMRCKHCKSLLDLNLILKETRFGLASVLYIMCQCGLLNDVHTGKQQDTDSSRPLYEVNIKASINMLLYGMGVQNIISFLRTGLDIPLPPPEDTSFILPLPHSPGTTAAALAPSYSCPASGVVTCQSSQGTQLQPSQSQQPHAHLLGQEELQPQVLTTAQVKELGRPAQASHIKGLTAVSTAGRNQDNCHKAAHSTCTFCQPCPHHANPPNPHCAKPEVVMHHHIKRAGSHTVGADTRPTGLCSSTKKPPSPEKVKKLTKDERDDLKINTKCTVCKLVFRSREHYRMHKILHPQLRKKQRVKCPSCSAHFSDRARLKQHQARLHSQAQGSGDKPFKCQLCEKSFNKKSQCSKHFKRCHVKENSHVCHVCGRRTFTKSELREHVRIHTGERPYQCEVCERSFRRKDFLTVHMRQHTGSKPYTCPHCGEAFVQRVSLCKHLQTKHPTVSVSIAATVGENAIIDAMTPQTLTHHHPLPQHHLHPQPAVCGHSATPDSTTSTLPILHDGLYYQ